MDFGDPPILADQKTLNVRISTMETIERASDCITTAIVRDIVIANREDVIRGIDSSILSEIRKATRIAFEDLIFRGK